MEEILGDMQNLDLELQSYIAEARETFKQFCIDNKGLLNNGRCRNHPGRQRIRPDGLKLHILQTIRKALELNQTCDRQEIIETLLVHDLPGWNKLPLKENQILAIKTTKGTPYEVWRPTPFFRFVALILIADMWSAFINEKDL